jgi:hypothetical protein
MQTRVKHVSLFYDGDKYSVEACMQRRLRIRLSVAALAYEFYNTSIMSDSEFDEMSQGIIPRIETGNKKLDNFFKNHFVPYSGNWIAKHPEIEKIKEIFQKYHLT